MLLTFELAKRLSSRDSFEKTIFYTLPAYFHPETSSYLEKMTAEMKILQQTTGRSPIITSNTLTPGMTNTDLFTNMPMLFQYLTYPLC
jgi:hypothetical protein